jgi:hypothetical protein
VGHVITGQTALSLALAIVTLAVLVVLAFDAFGPPVPSRPPPIVVPTSTSTPSQHVD